MVVGQSSSTDGAEAIRWTANAGLQGLGDPPGGYFSSAAGGVSADGSVVVGGGSTVSRPAGGYEPIRWQGTTIMPLGFPATGGGPEAVSYDTSADGSVVVGFFNTGVNGKREAFRWEAGLMQGLGTLTGGNESEAFAVSDDGSIVIGRSNSNIPGASATFRWENGVMDVLSGAPEGSIGYGMSPDGSIVVGGVGDDAFSWHDNTTTILPRIGTGSRALDVSADGSVIVGLATIGGGSYAVMWDETHGNRTIQDFLSNDLGLAAELAGWQLTTARAVSADGTTIVGHGVNPDGFEEGWVAVIPTIAVPEPSSFVLMLLGTAFFFACRHSVARV